MGAIEVRGGGVGRSGDRTGVGLLVTDLCCSSL